MRSERDCIEATRARLEQHGIADGEIKAIDDDVKRIVQDAAEFAQSSPEPEPSELWTDVLVEG